MDRATKQTEIQTIKERFDRMVSAVLIDYQGLNVETITKLRNEFRKNGVEYRVAKNTLVKLALRQTSIQSTLDSHLVGMIGVAWSYEEPGVAAKIIKNFRKDHAHLKIRGAIVDGQLLNDKQVEDELASMPGKNELRATLLSVLQAPMQNFVRLLNAPSQNFVYLLDAKQNKEG